jgi:four helix bundle protein
MTPQELRDRCAAFAVDAVALARRFRPDPASDVARPQLIRAATGVSSNYRASGHARSRREFASRLAIALEEADESVAWLEFASRVNLSDGADLARLLDEARQLARILGASRRTAARNANRPETRLRKPAKRPKPRRRRRAS